MRVVCQSIALALPAFTQASRKPRYPLKSAPRAVAKRIKKISETLRLKSMSIN
jgi:hypothetical protein